MAVVSDHSFSITLHNKCFAGLRNTVPSGIELFSFKVGACGGGGVWLWCCEYCKMVCLYLHTLFCLFE